MLLRLVLALAVVFPAVARAQMPVVVTDDVHHFWEAYDRITATDDPAEQARLLDALFLQRGTPGLEAMMTRRELTAAHYLDAIRTHPRFWASIRANTLRADALAGEIEAGIEALRAVYPALRPARVYFTVGAFMTGGMTLDDVVFIGSEIAMADSTVVTDEFEGGQAEHLRRFFDTNPVATIASHNVHEYVHTQQGPFGSELLSMALQEGVASFVEGVAMGQVPPSPAFGYEPQNRARVREAFERDLFRTEAGFWMWSSAENPFGVRDLGYAVGYAIAEGYAAQAETQAQAVADLIELDYRDPGAVAALVDASGYFDRPVAALRDGVPRVVRVVRVEGIENEARDLAPGPRTVTLVFSRPMDTRFRSFELGPLGVDHILRIARVDGWSEDGRRLTVGVDLAPGRRHQVEIASGFRSVGGVRLAPYLIDVTTSE